MTKQEIIDAIEQDQARLHIRLTGAHITFPDDHTVELDGRSSRAARAWAEENAPESLYVFWDKGLSYADSRRGGEQYA